MNKHIRYDETKETDFFDNGVMVVMTGNGGGEKYAVRRQVRTNSASEDLKSFADHSSAFEYAQRVRS